MSTSVAARPVVQLKEAEILEPLIPTIKNTPSTAIPWSVNAGVLGLAIFKSFDYLLPDCPELVEKVLQTVRHGDSSVSEGAAATASSREPSPRSDVSCKRNAFLMLFQTAQERAVAFPKISTR